MQTKIEKINSENVDETIAISVEQFGDESWTPAQFHDCITDKNYLSFLLRVDNKSAAFLIAQDQIDSINLLLIATRKDYKKNGFATVLLDHLLKIGAEKKVKVWLEVKENNLPAINLYKKAGFIFLYERKRYYKDGSSALIFENRHLDIT